MKKSELLKLIETLGDEDSVLESLSKVEGLSKFDASKLALEDFTKLLEENATIKGYWTSEKEGAVNKGVDTFKENNLQKLIEEGIKAKSNEGKSPEAIAVEKLEAKVDALEKEKVVAINKANYTKTLTEKGLSADLLDFIYTDDVEAFTSNIEKINTIITSQINSGINSKLQDNNYIPPSDNSGGRVLDGVEKAFLERNPNIQL